MQTPENLHIDTLSGEWRDKDIVMLHACFQLLTDCVEKENLLTGHVIWDHNDDVKNAKIEIQTLYDWWLERKNMDDWAKESSEKYYAKDNEMLIRLIQVRKYLWT